MNEMTNNTMFDRQVLEGYFAYLETMTAENVSDLANHCSQDMHFRDPFNNVKGVDKYIKIMKEAFHDLDNVRFEILETSWSGQGAFIKWHFHFKLGKGDMEKITGVSEVKTSEGKIVCHLDYWDSGERIFAKIPVVGGLYRFIRKKLSINEDNVSAF